MYLWVRIAAALSTAVTMAGCQTVESKVTVFHTISEPRTVEVKPAANVAGSLESATYANLIAAKLSEKGWGKSNSPNASVYFAYGIDNGRTEIGSAPVYGQIGGGTTYSSGSIYGSGGFGTYSGTSYTPATFGVVGSQTYSYTVFNRQLRVWVEERGSGKRIYEATVESRGSSSSFNVVAQCMIEALFKEFPGQSGKTKSVTLNGDACMAVEPST